MTGSEIIAEAAPPARVRLAVADVLYSHRVCPAEVDGFNVVHFSNYLRWVSAALMELFEKAGLGPGRFCDGTVEIRVGRAQMAYVSSARLGDPIEASIRSVEFDRSSMILGCAVQANGRVLSRGRLTIAFVLSATGALTPVPDEVRAALARGRAA
ncbi:acyl-CoA thioesterase (plasmid) [Skermanella mucosa]|uniref:Acyl-CoA thioesterase n=1 Tax=Skermanella cutis TaxID=2775420 RepID=A0ABX7BHA8_9PROT|nr:MULTISPECIES: acyl-CoA thioesterase [Skermanella]QQP93459.1 acyl-CoA thioesterase [Skermanella sp. TT6]UEM24785.1 acyl-CoA thioesterase [Skermanella mucosa]